MPNKQHTIFPPGMIPMLRSQIKFHILHIAHMCNGYFENTSHLKLHLKKKKKLNEKKTTENRDQIQCYRYSYRDL